MSQDQIFEALEFEFDRNIPDIKDFEFELSSLIYYLDSDSFPNKDSLLVDFEKYQNFDICLEMYRNALYLHYPEPLQTFLLNKAFLLAENNYETVLPILYYFRANRDYDKIMSTYDLINSWKGGIDRQKGNGEEDKAYNNTVINCMKLAIMTLEDAHSPIIDSIATIIVHLSNIGFDACSQFYDDKAFHPTSHFFSDKRIQFAYQVNDPNADNYADYHIEKTLSGSNPSSFLYHYLLLGGYDAFENRFFTDPIFLRYKSSLKQKDYSKARELLSLIMSDTRESFQDPINPFYSLHDSIQFANRQFIDIALPYAQYDLATISENARLKYLTHEDDFWKWSNGSFLTGAWYLSPSEGFLHKTIDCLFNENVIPSNELTPYISVNYNNPDARWVYNTALYLKGATTKITNSIERAIHNSENRKLIEDLKAIKREHVFSSLLDTADIRYVALNDSVETIIGTKMKETLADCFYSFADIKNSLSEKECAIEIVKAPSLSFEDDVYKAVILKHDWEEPKLVSLVNSPEVIKDFISSNYYNTSSSRLYSDIWKPLEKYLSSQDVVYIAPDGVLSLVNFSAIMNDKGECLSDIYDIHQCVSTKSVKDRVSSDNLESISLFGGMNYDEIADKDTPSLTNGTIVYRSLGNRSFDKTFEPLPGTEKEVTDIQIKADKHNVKSHLFTGKEGNEYNFKDLTGGSESIIHVATHGFYYSATSTKGYTFFEMISVDDNPYDRCGLLFSGGNKAWKGESIPDYLEDGILQGSEIARMDLSRTDLVVLSACDTGLGEIGEEGVAGLQMAFKQAGVKTLLMTLGKVDDEATAFFMTTFYENLFSGKDKHLAFKEAINTMRSSEHFSDPKYWSPFIMID